MNHLYLVRHAEASNKEPNLGDDVRHLTEKGRNDARLIARYIKEKGVLPTTIVSSCALRARTTAVIFADEWKTNPRINIVEDDIYYGSIDDYWRIINNYHDTEGGVLIVGHNPTISQLVAELSKGKIDHMPTCGFASFNLAKGKKDLPEYILDYYTCPKMLYA